MTSKARFLILLLSASLAPACSDSAPPPVEVLDSAGIRVVQNNEPSWSDGSRWTIESEPALTIGTAVGEWPYELHSLGSPVRLSDGRIAVPVGTAGQVRFFDRHGLYLTHFGRPGHGPGEFSRPGRVIERPGGDLWVWDGYEGRLSVFSPTGSFERSVPVPFGSAWAGGFLVGVTSEGVMIFTLRRARPGHVTGERRDPEYLVAFDPVSETSDTIAELPGRERFHANIGEASNINRVVFGRASFAAVGSSAVVHGSSDRFELRITDSDGNPVMVVRKRHSPIAVDESTERWAREEAFDPDVPNPTLSKLREYAFEHVPARPTLPAFGEILVDDLDYIWVRRTLPPQDPTIAWHVFEPTGRWLGDIETPYGLEIEQIGRDFIVGTGTDEWDAPFVAIYALRRPDRGSAPHGSEAPRRRL